MTYLKFCFAVAAIVVMMTGCKSVRYVPVDRVHTDTVLQTKVQLESIYVQDSVYVATKGDTVLMERWHVRWRERVSHDTLYKSRVDSIPVPIMIDRPLSRWQAFCLDYGKVMTGATVILALLVIFLFVKRIRAPTR